MGNDFLFTRIKQGDEKALEKFTKENYLFFCALANRYVNDVQEAEDIVQEVLIRLWENRRHYQDITCLRSFVYTMIRNQSLNLIRNRKRSSQHFHLLPEEEENNFFNILVEEESNRLLFNAINTLAPQSAAIIQLSLQGLKNEEIARELSISENTVKVLKYRSLKKLRQLLDHFQHTRFLYLIYTKRHSFLPLSASPNDIQTVHRCQDICEPSYADPDYN